MIRAGRVSLNGKIRKDLRDAGFESAESHRGRWENIEPQPKILLDDEQASRLLTHGIGTEKGRETVYLY